MKKIMMLLMVAVLMMGFSGKAMAAFALDDLIRVVYQDNGTIEQATDLGAFSATSAFTTETIFSSNAFSPSQFGQSNFNDLWVAYFVGNGSTTQAWVSGPETGQTSGSRKGGNFESATANVYGYYSGLSGGAAQATGSESGTDSYIQQMNQGSNGGTMGPATAGSQGIANGFIPAGNVDANLAALTSGGVVDQYLYYYGSSGSAASGVALCTIETEANGTTIINPSEVPVPAAIYLLGSGLVGLVGMRRKMSV